MLQKRLRQLLLHPDRRNTNRSAGGSGNEAYDRDIVAAIWARLGAHTQTSENLISFGIRRRCARDLRIAVRVAFNSTQIRITTMSLLNKTLAIGAVISMIAVSTAVAQMQGMDMQKMMQTMTPSPNDPPSTKDLKQAHMDMMKNMNMEFSGDADVDFARSMIPHHQGAIDMAKLELKYGKDQKMRQMAEKMIKDQQKEQKDFQAFLQKHKK
jgi:hypothetical protein